MSLSSRSSKRDGRPISGLPFFFFLLAAVLVVDVGLYPLTFAAADSVAEAQVEEDAADVSTDAINLLEERVDEAGSREDITAKTDADSPIPLPASLMKATRVGAKIREVRNPQDEGGSLGDEITESEMMSPNEEESPNAKPPLTGCHWGATGCNKGKRSNSSSIEADDGSSIAQGDGNGIKSLAGSATAKIKARVKGRGPTMGKRGSVTSPPVWERDTTELNSDGPHGSANKPPHGFKLAGRVVTSLSDGLSYFLDVPKVNPEDRDGDWMMTIPYAYLECGPTIESTTDAFSLSDLVVRHFPSSASMGHWTNLAGGVTVESDVADGEDGGPTYIEGNSHDGHPKLLVALTPIEITVSGNDEESRIFNPGDVILMEDTLGKGHKLSAAPLGILDKTESPRTPNGHSQDMRVLMVTLPHTIHLPMYDWIEESSYLHDSDDDMEEPPSSTVQSSPSSTSPPTSIGAEDALFGFAPKHLHQKHRSLRKRSKFDTSAKKPCPLEYDSAYSSLFMPTHNQYRRHRRSRRNQPRWRDSQIFSDSTFDESYPPPPGFTTYDKDSILLEYLPSLRRTMLFGIGLSLTSSFIYCVQLLYPPLLALWGGGTMILGGALVNVLATRWGYRRFVADWEEEWRWKREVRRNKMHREEMAAQQEDSDSDDTLHKNDEDLVNGEATNKNNSDKSESLKEEEMTEDGQSGSLMNL